MHSEEVLKMIPRLRGSAGIQASKLFVYWYTLQFRNPAAAERTDRARGGISTVPNDSDNYASLEEVRAALEQLSRNTPDMLRLEKIARSRARGLKTEEGKDLLHTAFEKAFAGERRWPKDVPIIAFMAQSIRGIAGDIRKKEKLNAAILSHAKTDDDVNDVGSVVSQHPDPEGQLHATKLLEKIRALFDDDEEAHAVLGLSLEGHSTKEIQKRLSMTPKLYATVLRRIRRKLNKLPPQDSTLY